MKRQGILVALLFLSIRLIAQQGSYTHLVVNEDSGLPQNFVYAIHQDASGFIWVGTGKGLVRYDGKRTQTFLHEQGLAENFVTASIQAHNGLQFFGHYSGAVTVFNGVFHDLLVPDTVHSEVMAFAEDSFGSIWVASKSGGLINLAGDFKSWSLVYPGELQGKIIHSMITLQNQLVIGTSEGLHTFIISKNELIYKDAPADIQFDEITSLASPPGDTAHFWAGSSGSVLFRMKAGVVTSVEHKLPLPVPELTTLTSIREDANGYLWVGVLDGGLHRFELQRDHLITTKLSFNPASGFPIQAVKTIFLDANQDVWAGTLSDGLVKIFRQPFQFVELARANITQVNDITHKSGQVYLATEQGVFVIPERRLDEPDLLPFRITKQPSLCVLPAGDSVIWFATASNGVFKYDLRTGDQNEIHLPQLSGSKAKVRFFQQDPEGNTWISSVGQGVYQLSPDGKVLKHLTTLDGFIHNNIYAILPEHNGRVWFGSLGAGLAMLDSNDSLHLLSQQGVFPSHDVNDITSDGKGRVWFATDGQGFFQYDGGTFTQPIPSLEAGIPFVKGIAYDTAGGLWLTHRKGVSYLNLTSLELHHFGQRDGLSLQLSYASHLVLATQSIIINNELGFTKANRQTVTKPVQLVPVITGVYLFFDRQARATPSAQETASQQFPSLELPHDQNHLTFQFTSVAHGYRGPVYYRYFISEIEPQWSPVTTENKVTYSSLNPGQYTLKIQASIDPNQWSNPATTYTFVILKPYWQKAWFYALQTLGICLIFGITFYLSRTARAKGSVVSMMVFMCLFIIYEYTQDWAETILPSLQGSAPILKTLVNFVFAFALYPIERIIRKFFYSGQIGSH